MSKCNRHRGHAGACARLQWGDSDTDCGREVARVAMSDRELAALAEQVGDELREKQRAQAERDNALYLARETAAAAERDEQKRRADLYPELVAALSDLFIAAHQAAVDSRPLPVGASVFRSARDVIAKASSDKGVRNG